MCGLYEQGINQVTNLAVGRPWCWLEDTESPEVKCTAAFTAGGGCLHPEICKRSPLIRFIRTPDPWR